MVDSTDAHKSCLRCLEQIALLPSDTDEDMSALAKLEIEISRGRIAKVETEVQTTVFDNWWEFN